MWPFTRSKNGIDEKPPERTPEEVAADEAEAARRKVRRDAAQKRIVASLREAQEARETTISIEAEHVKATDDRHKKAETTIRKAQEQASEVSGVFGPRATEAAEGAV